MGHQGATIREENTVKKCVSARSILRLKHLQKIATWASKEASVPPLSAFFGRLLAAHAEAAGAPLDPFLFACERCETILQPGYNCTVRINKNEIKARPCKRLYSSTQSSVMYKCHFCSHQNLKGGMPTGHVKELLATKQRCKSTDKKSGNVIKDSAAKGELYENKQESIYLNSKSVSASEVTSSGKIEAAKYLSKNTTVTPMEKICMTLSKKKSKVSILGEDASGGKILNKSKKSSKALCNLKETPKSSERQTRKSRISDILVIPVEKKGSILSKKKRKASISGSDLLTATKNCFVATDSDKTRGTKRKRRKLLHVMDEIPIISGHQPLLSVHGEEGPAIPSEKLGEKSSKKKKLKKKKKASVSGSDKQSAGNNRSAATDSGKSVGGSSMRKRKFWHSLKEIAETDEHKSMPSISNLSNPFPLTRSHDAPIVKQKERDCSMKLLKKQAKQKKTAKSDIKLSSSKTPNGKGQMKCKEGQSAQASVSSTSNELMSCVRQTDATSGFLRNLVSGRSMSYLSTMNSGDFHFTSQGSNACAGLPPPITMAGHHLHCLSPGSNVAFTHLSPAAATNQLSYLSQGSNMSATMQSPIIMPSHQHSCLSQVSNTAVMQQTPGVMASDQLHFLTLGPNMSAVQQSPIAIDGHQIHHLSQVCDRSAMLQSPIAMAGHQLYCLGQGPDVSIMHQLPVAMASHQLHILGQASNLHCLQQSPVVISGHQIHHLNQEACGVTILRPPALVTDHQLQSLSQEALMVAQPRLFPHYSEHYWR